MANRDPQAALAKWQRVADEYADDPEVSAKAQAKIREISATLGPSNKTDTPGPWHPPGSRPPAPSRPEPPAQGFLAKLSAAAKAAEPAAAYLQQTVDKYTFGAYPKLTDALGLSSPEMRQGIRDRNPTAAALGDGTGMGLGAVTGPASLAARAGTRAAEALGVAARPVAGNVVAGATGGALTEGAESAIAGRSAEETGKRAALGGAGGAAVGGLLGSLAAAAKGIRTGKGAQARETIEQKGGGEVGLTTSGRGGMFDNELAGLEPNDRGIGEASRRSAERVIGRLDDIHDETVMSPHVRRKAAIASSPAGQSLRDPTPIYDELLRLHSSQKLLPQERAQLEPLIKNLERTAEDGTTTVKQLTETELNDLRAALMRLSRIGGQNPSVPEQELADVAGAAKGLVDEGPYAKTNALFSDGTTKYEAARNRLDLPKRPPENPRISTKEGQGEQEVAKLANALARQKQNTVTSGVRNNDRYKNEFLEEPFVQPRRAEFERDIDAPEVLRAKGELEFVPPGKAREFGGLIERMPPAAGLGASLALALSGQDAKVALSPLLIDFLAKNSAPLAGRVLYKPAGAVQDALTPEAQMRLRAPMIELLRAAARRSNGGASQ